MNSKHPKYSTYGNSISLYGVFYIPLASFLTEDITNNIYFAHKGVNQFTTIPLKNEIVKIEFLAAQDNRDTNSTSRKSYWTCIVPLWNHPHHNAYPDTLQFPSSFSNIDLGPNFKESSKISPLRAFEGDTIMEGRTGQSLRFSSTKASDSSNPWIDSSNNGNPLIILRNGQDPSSEGDSPSVENINKDSSSIYLTSNHTVKLEQSNTKRSAWKSPPTKAEAFKGSQVLINADRLYFNARKESTFISSKKSIGLNADSISIDGASYIGLDATKIYLGVNALKREAEPVLLGQTSIDWMSNFLQLFEQLTNIMSIPNAPPAYVAACVASANSIKPSIPVLKQQLQLLLSKKVFTE